MVLVAFGLYSFFMYFLSTKYISKSESVEELLVGNRSYKTLVSALSIAATWIWAPALFVSSERAYMQGFAGLFWFLVPNIITLLLFAPFAKKLRQEFPKGYSLAGFMNARYSKKVRNTYLAQMSVVSILSTSVQIIAGGALISANSQIPYWLSTGLIAFFCLSYSIGKGINVSIITDSVKMIIMMLTSIALLVTLINQHNVSTMLAGMSGALVEDGKLFSSAGMATFLSFGLSSSIGLISGTFGDQSFWQLAYSTKEQTVSRTFKLAAFFFALVPLSLGLVGFLAAGVGFVPENTGQVNIEFMLSTLPGWVLIPFMFMVLSGLLGTIDSNSASISALVNETRLNKLKNGVKYSPIALIILSLLIANIPNIKISDLFLFYGTVRATTMIPTVLTLKKVHLHERAVNTGVITSLVIGTPVFVYGALMKLPLIQSAGSLLALGLSGIVAYTLTRYIERNA